MTLRRTAVGLLFGVVLFLLLGPAMAQTPRDRFRPLWGGIQIDFPGGPLGDCTNAYIAYWVEVQPMIGLFDNYGFVTASHCTDLWESVYQPTEDPNNYVGYTNRDPPFPRDTDTAFVWAETVGHGEVPSKVQARIYSCRSRWNYDYVVGYRSTQDMNVGDWVSKVGMATNCTTGQILVVDRQINLAGYGIVRHVAETDYDSAGGDSGGAVHQVDIPANPDYPGASTVYGSHVGSDPNWPFHRFFTHIDYALDELDINLYGA